MGRAKLCFPKKLFFSYSTYSLLLFFGHIYHSEMDASATPDSDSIRFVVPFHSIADELSWSALEITFHGLSRGMDKKGQEMELHFSAFCAFDSVNGHKHIRHSEIKWTNRWAIICIWVCLGFPISSSLENHFYFFSILFTSWPERVRRWLKFFVLIHCPRIQINRFAYGKERTELNLVISSNPLPP